MPRFYAAERGFDRRPPRVIAQQRPDLRAAPTISLIRRPRLSSLLSSSHHLVSAAPCGFRVVSSYLHLTPHEGWMERRQAHSSSMSRVRGATIRVSDTRAVPLQPGRPLGAPPWRFSAGDPRCRLRQWGTGADQRLACARPYGPAGGIPDLPRQRFAPPPQDATPRSACRIVSGDAPHERGCESM